MRYKTNIDIVVPVSLVNATTGLPDVGVLFGAVSVTIIKPDGSTVTYTPTALQWVSQNSNAYANTGYYNLTVPSANNTLQGVLQYAVAVVGDDVYTGAIDITDVLESETYALIQRILGLSYDNVKEDQQVYDVGKRLTSARLRLYDSAANAIAGGAPGLLYTYAITATYDGSGNCTDFTMVRNP